MLWLQPDHHPWVLDHAPRHRLRSGETRLLRAERIWPNGMRSIFTISPCGSSPWLARSLRTLATMWVPEPGYFCRAPWLRHTKFAFTNYGVSLGLQAAGHWPERVGRLNAFFETWRSGDHYDREAITWVMACTSHLPGAFLIRSAEPARA